MHVSKRDYNPVQTSSSEENNKTLGTNGTGSIAGRTANQISPSTPDDSALIKSATSAHSQLERISNQASQDPKPTPTDASPLNISIIKNVRVNANGAIRNVRHLHDLPSVTAELVVKHCENLHEGNVLAHIIDEKSGEVAYKSLNSQATKNIPTNQLDKVITTIEIDGKTAVLLNKEDAETFQLQNPVLYDKHGNQIEYEIIILDEETHEKLHASILTFVDNFVAARLEMEKAKQNEQREDVQREHTRHPNPIKSFRPPAEAPEKKTEKKTADVDSLKLLLATPESIVKSVIAAERAMEANQQEKDRIATEKKKRIREQEENREIRHESYKKAEIQGIEKQHDILKHEINDQERGRPAPMNPTKRRRIEP